jgi:hypothetical protein
LKASPPGNACRSYQRQTGGFPQFELPGLYGCTVRSGDYLGAAVRVTAGVAGVSRMPKNAQAAEEKLSCFRDFCGL